MGELKTDSYLPTLKAISRNGYDRLMSIQAFQYTGQSSLYLDLFINLHSSSSGTVIYNGIRADIGIVDAGSSLSGYDDDYFNYDFGTVFYEPSDGHGLDNTNLHISEEQDVNKQDILRVPDAWNMLGMSFADSSDLLSAVPATNNPPTSAPEPSTWAIFALSLIGFTAKKTKKQKNKKQKKQ